MALDLAKAWFSDSPAPSYRPQTRHLRVRSRNVFHPSGKPSASLHACQGTANAPHLLDHLLGRDGMFSCSSKQEEDPLLLAALHADVFCLLEVQQLQPNILLHPLEARKPPSRAHGPPNLFAEQPNREKAEKQLAQHNQRGYCDRLSCCAATCEKS